MLFANNLSINVITIPIKKNIYTIHVRVLSVTNSAENVYVIKLEIVTYTREGIPFRFRVVACIAGNRGGERIATRTCESI